MKVSSNDLRKLIIISSICFLIVWYAYVYKPVGEEINNSKTMIAALEMRISELKINNEQLLSQKLEEIINKEKSKELENYLVKGNSVALGIMNEIMQIAKKYNIAVLSANS